VWRVIGDVEQASKWNIFGEVEWQISKVEHGDEGK